MLEWQGRRVVDPAGDRIGTVQQVFVDADSDEARWAMVGGGLFGRSAFVPLPGAVEDGEAIRVAYYRDRVRSSPHVGSQEGLSASDEEALYRHYDLEPPVDANIAAEVLRSEERLDVDLVPEPIESVVVRKRVVTEYVTETVAVRREELVVEREPAAADDGSTAPLAHDVEIGEDETTVTLYREVPVVSTRVVPVERVRLRKNVVTEEVEVSGEVRREAVDVEPDGAPLDEG